MLRRSTFAVSFHIHRGKSRKGTHPIIMRISVNAKNVTLYTKRHIRSEDWDVAVTRVRADSSQAEAINGELERLKSLAIRLHERIRAEHGIVTAAMIKQALQSEPDPSTLLEIFRELNADCRKRVSNGRSPLTVESYKTIYDSVAKFIRLRYSTEDISLKRLDITLINDYEFYLRVTSRLSPRTVRDRVLMLRQLARIAIARGLLDRDPFSGYIPERMVQRTDFLTEEELDKILSLDIQDSELCLTRDLFVFSAFTGLSVCDIRTLRPDHLCRCTPDYRLWIIKKRENTDKESKVLLFDIPQRIIRKYHSGCSNKTIFNTPRQETITSHMRLLSRMCGLDREIFFRMARPAFARLVTLPYGVPVETVSRIMGYSSAVAAAKFTSVGRQKVAGDMEILSRKMEGLYKLPDLPRGGKLED